MSERINQLLQQLTRDRSKAAQGTSPTIAWPTWWSSVSGAELRSFWQGVRGLNEQRQLAATLLSQMLHQTQPLNNDAWRDGGADLAADIAQLYRHWPAESGPRHGLLLELVQAREPAAWRAFAELIVTDPPRELRQAIEVFLPLFRQPIGPVDVLFPRLLDALQHLTVAALVLDLANFFSRQSSGSDHPARSRATELTWLLGQLVERLEAFEQSSREQGVQDLQTAAHVEESITLAIALAHTLVRLDQRDAVGKLYRMLELQHRRLRVEAAAALAHFGESIGRDVLGQMAAEPLVRLRVHAYAQELGCTDALPASLTTPDALAEAELVVRLSEPDLFGVPPLRWQLIDQRRLAWPGERERCACYLFQYTYALAQGDYTNIALVGPQTAALTADLTSLEPADVYALYAGQQAEHDELRRVPYLPTDSDQAQTASRWLSGLAGSSSWHDIIPLFWGECFGQRVLVASAADQSSTGTLIVEPDAYHWCPQHSRRPLTADLAYSLYLGRRLLRTFNPGFPDV